MRSPSRFYYPARGTDYPIAFTYSALSDVGVAVDGVVTNAWSLLNPGMLRLVATPKGTVCVYRRTEVSASTPSAPFARNSAFPQIVQRVQELEDDVSAALGVDTDGVNFDAHHVKIQNLAEPTGPSDAVTKAYVDAAVQAAVSAMHSNIVELIAAAIEHATSPEKTDAGSK